MAVWKQFWQLRRTRPGFVLLSGLTVAVLLVYPGVEWYVRTVGLAQPVNYQDYTVYAAAVETWQAGEPLYVAGEDGSFWGQYLYPPVFLLLFWPFTVFSHSVAGLLWGGFSVALLWLALQLVVARLGGSLAWWERLVGLWALVGFHPLLLSVKLGQTGGVLAALLSLALCGLLGSDHTQAALSGALTAAVGLFKLAYAPVGAHLLCAWRRFAGAILAGVSLLVVSIGIFGVTAHIRYLDVLAWGIAHGGGGERLPTASSWLPPYYRQLHWLPAAQFARAGIAGGVALLALLATDADREVFALGVATFLLITPLPYVYYFVAALPAIFVMVAVEFDIDGYPTLPIVVLLMLQIHAYGLRLLVGVLPTLFGGLPDFVYPLLQPGLWGVLVFFGLTAYRVGTSVTLPAFDSASVFSG